MYYFYPLLHLKIYYPKIFPYEIFLSDKFYVKTIVIQKKANFFSKTTFIRTISCPNKHYILKFVIRNCSILNLYTFFLIKHFPCENLLSKINFSSLFLSFKNVSKQSLIIGPILCTKSFFLE